MAYSTAVLQFIRVNNVLFKNIMPYLRYQIELKNPPEKRNWYGLIEHFSQPKPFLKKLSTKLSEISILMSTGCWRYATSEGFD